MVPKTFFPNLDGLRFLAFLSVFYYHSFSTQNEEILNSAAYKFIKGTTRGGELGVDFFFVLSGFLIIYLLQNEKIHSGRIHVRKFYIRRILRIFPLYYFCVFFGFVLFPVFKSLLGATPDETAHWPYYIVYLGNIDIYHNGVLPDAGVLGVLWSLAIEEQFYLSVPFILLVTPVRHYKWVFAFVLALSWIMRGFHYDDAYYLKLHTFSYIGNLAIGGLMAYYVTFSERFKRSVENANRWIIRTVYAAVIAIYFFRDVLFAYPPMHIFDTSIIAALFGAIILEQNYAKHSDFKMKNNRLFSSLGKYTYGLYCLHMLAAVIVLQITARIGLNKSLWEIVLLETPLMLLATIAMAYLSFRFYEAPFLRLKERFSVFQKARP